MKKITLLAVGILSNILNALELGEQAPSFTLPDQDSKSVTLEKSADGPWKVLFFYPKANTPGCTKQACAFRDSLSALTRENVVVYGISTSSVKDLKKFQTKHKLTFTLLSDEDGKVTKLYGAKYPVINIARRYTFILDPSGVIRHIEKDVDPVLDATRVAQKIKELKKASS